MPKEILTINDFSGGMNTQLDARDIEDNEFSFLSNFTGSSGGILKLGGQFTFTGDCQPGSGLTEDEAWASPQAHVAQNSFNIPSAPGLSYRGGYGTFTWSSDFNMLSEHNSERTATDFLLLDTRMYGQAQIWQYYNNGGQQYGSTGRDDSSKGNNCGWLPSEMKQDVDAMGYWYSYANGGGGIWPRCVEPKHARLSPNQSSVYGESDEGVYAPGTLGDDGANRVMTNYYAPDGNLRAGSGSHKYYGTAPYWFGYIPEKLYGVQPEDFDTDGISRVKVGGRWHLADASTEVGINKINTRMINSRCHTNGESSLLWSRGNSNSNSTGVATNVFNAFWGVTLDYQEEPIAGHGALVDPMPDAQTGTWQPTLSTRYKFYVTVLHDDIKQESHPTEFVMIPSTTDTPSEWDDSDDYGPSISGKRLGPGAPEMYFSGIDSANNAFDADDDTGSPTKARIVTNQAVYFKPILRLSSTYNGTFVVDRIEDGGVYPDGHDYGWMHLGLYDEDLEENLRDTPEIDSEDKFHVGGHSKYHVGRCGKLRYTGYRIYYSSNEDGHENLYAMFECDFAKGVKAYGMGSSGEGAGAYTPWEPFMAEDTHGEVIPGHIQPGWSTEVRFVDPPKDETYYSLNGRPHDVSTTVNWRTSAYVGGRMYVANYKRPLTTFFESHAKWFDRSVMGEVCYLDHKASSSYNMFDPEMGGTFYFPRMHGWGPFGALVGDTWVPEQVEDQVKVYPDSICKSPPGEYDIFPQIPGKFEMTFGESSDGDEIIHLDTTDDKLLVFKRNSMMIIVPSDSIDTIEATHEGMGLDGASPSQVCKTDFGIAWVNVNGCYHYDGSQVKELTAGKINNFIKNEGHNALPFNEGTTYCDRMVKSLRWTTPESAMEPNHDEYHPGGPSAGVKYPNGDIIQSIGFDPESKKLIWLKNSGFVNTGEFLGDGVTPNPAFIDGIGKPAQYGDILVYDFATQSWSLNRGGYYGSRAMAPFMNFKGQLLTYSANTSTWPKFRFDAYGPNNAYGPYEEGGGDEATGWFNDDGAWVVDSRYRYEVLQWTDNPILVAQRGPRYCHFPWTGSIYTNNLAISKDFTFGDVGVRKKIYKVYVSYRCKFGGSNVALRYRTNGNNVWWDDAETFKSKVTIGTDTSESSAEGKLFGPTDNYSWAIAELTPTDSSVANNVYSFQLMIGQEEQSSINNIQTTVGTDVAEGNHSYTNYATAVDFGEEVTSPGLGRVDSSFEINDISIVYRRKSIK